MSALRKSGNWEMSLGILPNELPFPIFLQVHIQHSPSSCCQPIIVKSFGRKDSKFSSLPVNLSRRRPMHSKEVDEVGLEEMEG
jgi:hypothetical protein